MNKKSMMGRRAMCAVASALCFNLVLAATTPIAQDPLFEGEVNVPPNVMVLMDTSESMSWGHMPDQMERKNKPVQYKAYKSSACNSVYYNPNIVYQLPKDAFGNSLPEPEFTAAFYDYYGDGGMRKVDLSKDFQAHDENTVSSAFAEPDVKQAAYYYGIYPNRIGYYYLQQVDVGGKSSYIVNKNGFRYYCQNNLFHHDANKQYDTDYYFNKVTIDNNSLEKQNFARWYSYYRTRMAMAKSSLSLAFTPIDDKYRVGFIAVNPLIDAAGEYKNKVQKDRYQKIDVFDTVQREQWYDKVFSQTSAGRSPAREGLARVGRHYAGKTDGINDGMPQDPVIHQCQRNYTIMTTDGYWNAADETKGAVQIDGVTLVGQQDNPWTGDSGLVPFGVYDGGGNSVGYNWIDVHKKSYYTDSCEEDAIGTQTVATYKDITIYRKNTRFTPGNDTLVVKKKIVERLKSSWTSSASFERYSQTTTYYNKINRRYSVDTGEGEKAVDFCKKGEHEGCQYDDTKEQVAECSNSQNVICGNPVVNTYYVYACDKSTEKVKVECGPKEEVNNVPVAGNYCGIDDDGKVKNGWSPPGKSGGWRMTCHVTNVQKDKLAGECKNENYTLGNSVSCKNGKVLQDWTEISAGETCFKNDHKGIDCWEGWVCKGNASNNGSCQASDWNYGTIPPVTSGGTVCVEQAASAANGWIEIQCEPIVIEGDKAIDPDDPDCSKGETPSESNDWVGIRCYKKELTSVTLVDNCTPVPASKANDWVETVCTDSAKRQGTIGRYHTSVTRYRQYPGRNRDYYNWWWDNNGSGEIGACVFAPDSVTLPQDEVKEVVTVVPGKGFKGSENSLADVAQYYYVTDLRAWMNKPSNWGHDVPVTGTGALDDKAKWQHMTTYVIGMGVSGTIHYEKDYKKYYYSQSERQNSPYSKNFAKIREGSHGWPVWPNPNVNYNNQDNYHVDESIDDFWHAAVNGRGQYFSTRDPQELENSIKGIFENIGAKTAVGTGVRYDTPVSPNEMYATSYVTRKWTGDLQARDMQGNILWSAQTKLATKVQANTDQRKIWMMGAPGTLVNFTAANIPAAQQGQLTSGLNALSQRMQMDAATKAQMTLESLVNYLRGQSQHEGSLYRLRDAVLGDLINSRPVRVAGAMASYVDAGYRDFKTAQATRKGMIYVGGNDGMLHAFYAPSNDEPTANKNKAGEEAWAYVPRAVMGNMYRLADENYKDAGKHRYFVDGSPVVGDVYDKYTNTWKTILVGGFNAGGKGYFALDITDPDNPKSLWETGESCASCDFGLSFGRPLISKMQGTWAVFVTSGYNNASGVGILYELDAIQGAMRNSYSTGVGTPSNPSGLAQVAGYAHNQNVNNTVERLYAGDLLGNIWRFDVNGTIGDSNQVGLLGTAKDATGKVQSITVAPLLASFDDKEYVVVGTGRLLDFEDAHKEQVHSIYVIDDRLNPIESGKTAVYEDLRAELVRFKMQASGHNMQCADVATMCDFLAKGNMEELENAQKDGGWLVDLARSREHVNLSMQMNNDGILMVGTNEPNDPEVLSCTHGALGRVHFLKIDNATQVRESQVLTGGDPSQPENTYLVDLGLRLEKEEDTPSGGSSSHLSPRDCAEGENLVVSDSSGKQICISLPEQFSSPDARMSWRELSAPGVAP